jgi:transcriptional regulator with XRE-family HTH domain
LHVPRKPREQPLGLSPSGDRLFFARRARGWSQQKLGDLAGIGRLQVLQLENGKNQGSAWDVRKRLADAFGVPEPIFSEYFDGTLPLEEFEKARNQPPLVADLTVARVSRRASEMSLAPTVLQALLGEGAEGLNQLPEEVRRAVLGVVHVTGYPLEQTIAAAALALEKVPPNTKLSPEIWYGLIRDELPKRPSSGTHLSAQRRPGD